MAISAEQIAALEQAIVSGTLEVYWESAGVRQRMIYQSTDAMLKALAYAKGEAVPATSLAAPQPSTLAVFERS